MLHESRACHELQGSGFPVHDYCGPHKAEISAPKKAPASGRHRRHRACLRGRLRAGEGGANPSSRLGSGPGSSDGAYICKNGLEPHQKGGESGKQTGLQKEEKK